MIKNLPMQAAYENLNKNLDSNDVDLICKLLGIIADESLKLSQSKLSDFYLDFKIKKIIKNLKCIEIIEKIGDLCHLIKDPRNFHDELVSYLNVKHLLLPTLMLMYQLNGVFKVNYDEFYPKLFETLTIENMQSEGYLLFILRCLNVNSLEEEIIENFLKQISKISVEVNSECCIKLVYCILVIMRIHPATFKFTNDLKELNMLIYSFESIKNIVQRIFIEAKYPEKRPKMVFLQNFAFPSFHKL